MEHIHGFWAIFQRQFYLFLQSIKCCAPLLEDKKHIHGAPDENQQIPTSSVWFTIILQNFQTCYNHSIIVQRVHTCVPAPKCGRRPHFGAVGIAGLYIGRLRNCLPFLTSFTQCRMANLHIKCFDNNAYQ